MYDIIDPNRTFGLEAFNLWGIREDMKDVEFIMHNGILYDMPTLDKVLGFNSEKKGIKIQDTYRMSQTLWPDMPGGHSVENWLKKLKGPNQKVQNEQWTEWDPIMIQRCKSDVLGTEEIYNELLRETEQRKQYC